MVYLRFVFAKFTQLAACHVVTLTVSCQLNLKYWAMSVIVELTFISGMHHYEWVAPNVDINLQSERFSVKSIASFRES